MWRGALWSSKTLQCLQIAEEPRGARRFPFIWADELVKALLWPRIVVQFAREACRYHPPADNVHAPGYCLVSLLSVGWILSSDL